MTALIISRPKAIAVLGSTLHLRHKWEPHTLLEDAWIANVNQEGTLDMDSLPKHRLGPWNISVISYVSDEHLELLVKPFAVAAENAVSEPRPQCKRPSYAEEAAATRRALFRMKIQRKLG